MSNRVSKSALRAACAAAALSTAWAGAQQAQALLVVIPGTEATLQTNFTQGLNDAYLIYGINSSGLSDIHVTGLGPIAAGTQSTSVFFEDPTDSYYSVNDYYWTVVGGYDTDLVSITINSSEASYRITNSRAYSDDFSYYTESELYTALTTFDTSGLESWASTNSPYYMVQYDQVGTQVNYSDASNNGTAQITPEPASIALLAAGGLVLLGRKRRR